MPASDLGTLWKTRILPYAVGCVEFAANIVNKMPRIQAASGASARARHSQNLADKVGRCLLKESMLGPAPDRFGGRRENSRQTRKKG